MQKISAYIILLALFLLSAFPVLAQQKSISIHANNEALSSVLEKISQEQPAHFAFDATYFSTIKTTLNLRQISLTDFIKLICDKYHLLSEVIDNTIVLYKNPAPLPEPEPELINLSGVVQDSSSGEPLMFCHVGFATTSSKGTITNEMGVFSANLPKQNQLKIEISHLGYQRLDTIIRLQPAKFHTISLKPLAINIEVIQVFQQEKNMVEMGNQGERIAFNPKQSANLPKIDDNDLISSLSLIPGISFLGGQTQGIAIRGSSPSENLISLDGIPVLETSHLFGNLSVLNSKYVSQAFVSRGGFDASSGEKTSGIVELKGKSNYYKSSLDLSANLLNVSATGNLALGKMISLGGSYRRSYNEQWENYLYKQILKQSSSDDESSVSPQIQFDDFNLKLGIRPSVRHEINVNLMSSFDLQIRDYEFKEGSRLYRYEDGDAENRGFSANWFFQANNNFNQRLTVGYTDFTKTSFAHSGMNSNSQGKGGKDELDRDNNYLKELALQWAGELKTGRFTHQTGMGVAQNQVSYNYFAQRSTGNKLTDSILFDTEALLYHAYLQEKMSLGKLKARIGLRANYLDLTSETYFQPRIGLSYQLSDQFEIIYAGGLYNQFLSRIRKIDMNGNSDQVWFLPDQSGNGILNAQQHLLGLQYEKNGWAVNAESYYKKTDGRVNLYAEQSGTADKSIVYVQREGESVNYGIDLMLQYKHDKFTHILSGSVAHSNEQFEVFNQGESYPSFDDQRVKLRWTEMAKWNGWVFASSVYFHSGSPYLASSQDGAIPEFNRLPSFLQADFSAVKRVDFKFMQLSAGISLLNWTNRQNVLEVDYFNVSDSTGSYSVRTDITAVRFTPVFFVSLLFD